MRNRHMENIFNSMISDISYLKLAYYSNVSKNNLQNSHRIIH